eukprot:1011674-Pyramimonas_sp.AAC.1
MHALQHRLRNVCRAIHAVQSMWCNFWCGFRGAIYVVQLVSARAHAAAIALSVWCWLVHVCGRANARTIASAAAS